LDLNQLIQKIPKPILVLVILSAAVVVFVFNQPLHDECEVQATIFDRRTKGLLSAVKMNNKIQYPQLTYWKERCKEGNSLGSCNDYIEGLRTITKELKFMGDKCQIDYSQKNENFAGILTSGLQIMALVAWGEKPPAGLAERLGWLNISNMQTFCHLKRSFLLIAGEENFLALREKVFREYPDNWPEKLDIENRLPENRPRAYKYDGNMTGTLKFDEVFQRSIFSIKCDLYM
jgi:hypothetical protein